MALLAVSNVFIPGNIIRSSEVNQNYTDILTWANGNITDVNFGTMTGTVSWSISTNAKALDITNAGTTGSITLAQNAVLAAAQSAVKISSNSAQSTGTALLEITSTSSSDNIPALLITDIGTSGPAFKIVSTTKGSMSFPLMTTTQRNALTPAKGWLVYDSSLNTPMHYNGSAWVALDVSVLTDNVTVEFAAGVLRVKDDGITTAKIADAQVTNAKIQNNPQFPGTNFGSAGSSNQFYGAGTTYNVGNTAANTLVGGYSGGGSGYRIVAGRIDGSGGVSLGEGFSASHLGTGAYRITPTIAGSAAIIGVVMADVNTSAGYQTAGSSTFDYNVYNVAGAPVDGPVNFILYVRV